MAGKKLPKKTVRRCEAPKPGQDGRGRCGRPFKVDPAHLWSRYCSNACKQRAFYWGLSEREEGGQKGKARVAARTATSSGRRRAAATAAARRSGPGRRRA